MISTYRSPLASGLRACTSRRLISSFLWRTGCRRRSWIPTTSAPRPVRTRLAAEGVRFPRPYTPNNICCPTRASIMTGLLPHNHGVLEVLYTNVTDLHVLREDRPHFAQRLQQAGYRTGYFGKWHVRALRRAAALRLGCRWRHLESHVPGACTRDTRTDVQGDAKGDTRRRVVRARKGMQPGGAAQRTPPRYQPYRLCGVTDRPAESRNMGFAATLALRFLKEAVAAGEPVVLLSQLRGAPRPLHNRALLL